MNRTDPNFNIVGIATVDIPTCYKYYFTYCMHDIHIDVKERHRFDSTHILLASSYTFVSTVFLERVLRKYYH